MAFCANCGTQVQDGLKFCPSCGTPIGAAAGAGAPPAPASQPTYQQPTQQPAQPPTQQPYQQPAQPPVGSAFGASSAADPKEVSDNKVMGILSYLIFFIPLLTGAHRTSPYVKFHVNQGTVLFLATLALSVVYGILTTVLTGLLLTSGLWGMWGLITTVLSLVWFAPTILCILGIINAAQGRNKKLPVIGRFTIIK